MPTKPSLPPPQSVTSLDDIPPAKAIIAWRTTNLKCQPYHGMWAFNPSIHFDGKVWRCVVRCSDYAMPGGNQIRAHGHTAGGVSTRNVMLHLDPDGWKIETMFAMAEEDGYRRSDQVIRGYEDMRLFWTEKFGLQGIAASTHLARTTKFSKHPEQVVVSFRTDGSDPSDPSSYDIVKVAPIRGEKWDRPQKNWSPFDGATEPMFLYSIERGIVATMEGPQADDDALVEPDGHAGPAKGPGHPVRHDLRRTMVTNQSSGVVNGRRVMPPSATESKIVATVARNEAKMLNGGKNRYSGLRGGTQLAYIGAIDGAADGADLWLGVGHEMVIRSGKKFYWHRFYAVDSGGTMVMRSGPIKLAPEGIEFAAGMAIAGDRVVISFGVDDALCRLGETSLEDIIWCLEQVRPEDRTVAPLIKHKTSPPRILLGTSGVNKTQQGRPILRGE